MMESEALHTAAWVAFCSGLAASGVCLGKRLHTLRELKRHRRYVFEERAEVWLAEEADGAPYYGVEDMLRKSVEYGSDDIRDRLSAVMASDIASTVQEILRSEGSPHHVIGHLEEVLMRLARLTHMLKVPRASLLLPHLTPDELQRFEHWEAVQRRRGWKAFVSIVWKYHYGQIHAIIASALFGVVKPLLASADTELMKAVGSQCRPAELVPVLLRASALQLFSTVLRYFSSNFVHNMSAKTSRGIRKRCVDNVARSDLVFLSSLQSYHIVESLERDQEELKRALTNLQILFQFTAHAAALVSLIKVSPLTGLQCCASAVLYRLLVGALRRLETSILVAYEKEDQGVIHGYKSLWDLFGCINTFMSYRFYGQEARLAEHCLAIDEKEHEVLAHNTGLLGTLLQPSGSVELILRRFCRVLTCLVGQGHADALEAFSNFEDAVETATEAVKAVQSIRSLWLPSLRVHMLLTLPRHIDRGDDVGLRHFDGQHDLAFCNLTFCYGSGETVLRNVSFSIPAGAHVGIVGPSGCGKSTLLSLISRLYDPQEGVVTLGGRPLSDYNVGWLRREVVSGTGHFMRVFSDSLYENARISRPDATHDEVMDALRHACAMDFAQEKGLYSRMEWGPPELSAGQEVRLYLARALLAKPKILVLDEVTAHLDALTEDAIRRHIATLADEGTTVINVSHRLSFLKDCGAIIVFDETGRIAAAGTHHQLLQSCEWYASACEKQSTSPTAASV